MAKKSAFSTGVAPKSSSGPSNRRTGRRSTSAKTKTGARSGSANAPAPGISGPAKISSPDHTNKEALRPPPSALAPSFAFAFPSPSRLLPQHYRRSIDPVLKTTDESSRLAFWRNFLKEYNGDVETLKLPLSCQMACNFLFLTLLRRTRGTGKGKIRAFNIVALVLCSLSLAIAQSFASRIRRSRGCWTHDDKQFLRRWRSRPFLLATVLSYPIWLYKLCILAELATVVVIFYNTPSLRKALVLAVCPALASVIGWMGLDWLGGSHSSSAPMSRDFQDGSPFLNDRD